MPQIKIIGTANTTQAQAQFQSLTAQVERLNVAMAQVAATPAGFRQVSRNLTPIQQAFNSALASSGAYRVESLKMNNVIEDQTKLLQKQKLGFREVYGKEGRANMRAVYREQLAMRDALMRTTSGNISDGSTRMSVAVPNQVMKSWDTLNSRVGMFGHQLASVSKQTVNWGKNTQWAGRQLMSGITMPVVAFGAAAGVMAYKVDQQFTRIQKVYDTTANSFSTSVDEQIDAQKELDQVRRDGSKTAMQAAKEYGSAITDTLSVQAELAAVGQKGARLQENTSNIMRIAMLGEIDTATATKSLIAMQSTLGATTKETGDMFNYLNAVENGTSLATADFAAAIPRALNPMKQMSREGASATEVLQNMSVLMTSMVERGIDPGEGANAIKSMMNRLYRPSKQIQGEWEKMAKVNPLTIVKEEGGDVMKILPRIAEIVSGMSNAERTPLLAGLFGSYQVARINAILDGFTDIKNGVGQATDVLKINAAGYQSWAKTAEGEQEKVAKSAAGQFKRVFETVKAQLALVGEPFLEVASTFLKAVGGILEFFNGLPKVVKKGILGAMLFAAVVGPVIMLVGLFANLAGNLGGVVAWAAKFVSSFKLVNRSQWAASVQAKLASKKFTEEALSAEVLTARMNALTLAIQEQAAAAARTTGVRLGPQLIGASATGGGMTGPYQPAGAYTSGSRAAPRPTYTPQPEPRYIPPTPQPASPYYGGRASDVAKQQAAAAARAASAEAAARAAHAEELSRNRTVNATNAQNVIQSNLTKKVSATAVAGGLFAASMAASMLSSNETVGKVANMGMILAIGVPVISSMVKGLGVMAARAAILTTSFKGMAIAQAGSAATLTRAAGTMGTMRAAAKGIGASFIGMMGPLGWAVTAAVAIGGALWLVHKHNEKIKADLKKQAQDQAKLTALTDKWADSVGRAGDGYAKFNLLQQNQETQDAYDEAVDFYSSKDQKPEMDAYDKLSSDQKQAYNTQAYIDLIKKAGLTAQEAKTNMTAFFYATGQSISFASLNATKLYEQMGDLKNVDWSGQLTMSLDNFSNSIEELVKDGNPEKIDALGKEVGSNFMEAFLGAQTPEQAKAEMQKLTDAALVPWENLRKQIAATPAIARNGNITQNQFEEISKDAGKLRDFYNSLTADEKEVIFDVHAAGGTKGSAPMQASNKLSEAASQAGRLDSALAGGVAQAGGLGTTMESVVELQKEAVIQAQLLTYEQSVQSAQKLMEGLKAANDNVEGWHDADLGNLGAAFGSVAEDTAQIADDGAVTSINAFNAAQGYKQATTATEALYNLVNKVVDPATQVADESKKVADNLKKASEVKIKGDQWKSILKDGMSGVMDDISESVSDSFENKMESAIDGAQATWDKKMDNLEDAQEKQDERFDKRYDRRERAINKYFRHASNQIEKEKKQKQARIDAIQKVMDVEQEQEDARQKMFEAEQQRLSRLADSANKTIDFNVALRTGNLDEAARVQNDISSTASSWALGDAADRSSNKNDVRQKELARKQEKIGDRMEELDNEQEQLDKLRDKRLKALDKEREDEKKHLDEIQEKRKDSLAKNAENAMKAYRAEWEARKKNLDDQLDLFKAYIPSSKAELAKWTAMMGGEFAKFGAGTLKPMSNEWGQFFNTSFKDHIHKAGLAIESDNMWESMGGKTAKGILNGMGFQGFQGFKKFITTGTLPDNFGKVGKATGAPATAKSEGQGFIPPTKVKHAGGFIGDKGNSRKGVARNIKGVGPGESMVLARNKEFMVNEKAAQQNSGLLQAINSGQLGSYIGNNSGYGGATGNAGSGLAAGIAGLVSAMAGIGLAKGIGASFENAFTAKRAQQTTGGIGGIYSAGAAGQFGQISFNAEQLKNAATIATVGSNMGMSARDIQIGIMTAIAESSLINLHSGDRDSQGLFQQRPSQGWGTVEEVTNPIYAATKFFNALKAVPDRDTLTPWIAAQSVQRSAFSDGSNYRDKWDEAQGIFSKGLTRKGNAFSALMGMFTGAGAGGKHAPSQPGKGWYGGYSTHDYNNALGSPIYAFNDGVISRSQAITSGGSPGNGRYPTPYRSYGEVIEVRDAAGNRVLSGHMRPGTSNNWKVNQPVAGGTLLGYSDMTGNASGPHTHFEWNGSEMARSAFQAYGIGLRTGGYTSSDGMANLHKDEVVIDPGRTQKIYSGIDAMTSLAEANSNLNTPRARVGYDPMAGTNGWTWGAAFANSDEYDPNKGVQDYLDQQAALIAEAKKNMDKMARKTAKDAARELVARTTYDFNHAKEELEDLQKIKAPQGKIDRKKAEKNGAKSRMEAAIAALEQLKGNDTEDEGSGVPVSSTANNGEATVKTGTYNVLFSTSNDKTKDDLSKLFTKADVLGLTEMSGGKRDLLPWIEKQGWGQQGGGDSVLTWNKKKLQRLDGADRLLNQKTTSDAGGKRRYATWGRFKDIETGRQFIQAVAHTISFPHKDAAHEAVQKEQFGNLRDMYGNLKKTGLPVFLGGDFNDDIRRNKMDFGGTKSNWEGQMKGNYTIGQSYFDNMFFDPGFARLIGQMLFSGSSDHKGLITEFALPSHKNGAENVRWDNTLVNLHKKESVLTSEQSDKFRNLANNIDQVATGGNTEYNIKVEVNNPNASADDIARAIEQRQRREQARRITGRRIQG